MQEETDGKYLMVSDCVYDILVLLGHHQLSNRSYKKPSDSNF